jgi:integrase/recombinase XerC
MENQYLDLFLKYLLSERNYSTLTAKSYLIDINQFHEEINKELLSIQKEDIYNFLYRLNQRGLSKRTQARKFSAIKSFYKYLLVHDYIKNDPCTNFKLPKYIKKLPEYLYPKQVKEILEILIGETPFLKIRNKLIIFLILDSGLRVSELCNLKLKDIDLTERTLYVIGKGNKERAAFFTNLTKRILEDYLILRQETLTTSEYLFISYQNKNISHRGVQKVFELYGEKLNLHLHPHLLRHTFATIMLDQGGDLQLVQELLGHTNLSTTQIYTHISDNKLKVTYNKKHPHGDSQEK